MLLFNNICCLLLFTYFFNFVESTANNACKNFEDYANLSSPNCFYNPDMLLQTPKLIKKYVGNYRYYNITTQDGYILKMFRIENDNPKGTILFHHSLGTDSRIWVGQGYNTSLAFYLWNAGYDIWMNNHRGTLFSQNHQSLSNKDFKYWDFSFHEVGNYDIPAEVEFIKKQTNGSKIIYIGHSFGSTSGLIYGSLHAEKAKKSIEAFIFMATPCFFKYSTSALTAFVPYKNIIRKFIDDLKLSNFSLFLPISMISRISLRMFPILLIIVNIVFAALTGWTLEETDPAIQNLDSGIYIKDFSWKIIMHYLQLIETQTRFQMFDYGKNENLQRYNSEIPPAYPLQNISVPTFLVSSEDDSLTTLKDSDVLLDILSKNIKIYDHIKFAGINHMQYFIGKHAKETYFDKILNLVNNISKGKKSK